MNLLLPKYNRGVFDDKRELFSLLGNENKEPITVLEIGAGSGGSLDFYPKDQPIKLIAVEPNIYCQSFLQKNLSKHENITLDKYIVSCAESMREVESNSVEAVISTIVMCSVEDQSAVLQEVKRVLKPSGRFYFMEHVAAKPDTWMWSIQNVLNFVWNILFDGCNINRNTSVAVDNAGFSKVVYKHFMAHKLGPLFYVLYPHIAGYAEK